MNDMSPVIVPKTDQLNSDSLMAGPITVTITRVAVRPGTEQPVSVFYEGDDGKPWKPCKSMARVLVAAWGPDSARYVGKSLTLYRDPKVKWGGVEVGGIRVSHMSDIAEPMTLALTETKAVRKPFRVLPLKDAPSPRQENRPPADAEPPPNLDDVDIMDWAASFNRGLAALETVTDVSAAWSRAKANGYVAKLRAESQATAQALAEAVNARVAEINAQ